ncbi:hypothetical protein IGI04_014553 [Brassica rapa subsp. trilocularis]|uniref:Uncharacterized protein n=1 Tax=Brassica rapa subsp. trilocularis TaxID=1813537 RepID=A0ABQ7MMI1_BRACM|nr:hypothetical protein IGI04_014553 [Brassica rapa subsp. trilocularis]
MIHNEIWNGSMGPLYTCISLVIIDEHWVFQIFKFFGFNQNEQLIKSNNTRERLKRDKVDLVPVSGRRVGARAVAGTSWFSFRLSSPYPCRSLVILPLIRFARALIDSHPETIARGANRHQRWLGFWSEGAVVWSSAVAGSSLREVIGFFSNVSSVLSPGGEGLHSLASPALVVRSGGFVFLDRVWRVMYALLWVAALRVLKAEEKWLRWRFSGIEFRRNEGVGGGAQAVSRVGDGQVEASVDAWRADDEMSTRVPSP